MEYLCFLLLIVIIVLQLVIICGGCRRKKPVLLMCEGRLLLENMKKHSVTADDLMSAARKAGYFNLADIDTAVLERDGAISLLPSPSKRRLTPRDFNFNPVREGLALAVYQDGSLSRENLRAVGFTEEKLARFLAERGYSLESAKLIIVSEDGRVKVY